MDKTEYKKYDELNNWQVKEQYTYGEISRLTKRKFLLKLKRNINTQNK